MTNRKHFHVRKYIDTLYVFNNNLWAYCVTKIRKLQTEWKKNMNLKFLPVGLPRIFLWMRSNANSIMFCEISLPALIFIVENLDVALFKMFGVFLFVKCFTLKISKQLWIFFGWISIPQKFCFHTIRCKVSGDLYIGRFSSFATSPRIILDLFFSSSHMSNHDKSISSILQCPLTQTS